MMGFASLNPSYNLIATQSRMLESSDLDFCMILRALRYENKIVVRNNTQDVKEGVTPPVLPLDLRGGVKRSRLG
jgi:hypothetical protein